MRNAIPVKDIHDTRKTIGEFGVNDEGQLCARLDGHGWQRLPLPPVYALSEDEFKLVYDATSAALSDEALFQGAYL